MNTVSKKTGGADMDMGRSDASGVWGGLGCGVWGVGYRVPGIGCRVC